MPSLWHYNICFGKIVRDGVKICYGRSVKGFCQGFCLRFLSSIEFEVPSRQRYWVNPGRGLNRLKRGGNFFELKFGGCSVGQL